jgi:hypothetical protein
MDKFESIYLDFKKDLLITFPELSESLESLNMEDAKTHVISVFPKHFFDILYERTQLFEDELFLLPNIDFSKLMNDEHISEKTKTTLWKYLQIVLFYSIEESKNTLLEHEDNSLNEVQQKMEETIENMKEVFAQNDISNSFSSMMNDMSSNFMDSDHMKKNIEQMMGGKIGSLAKEIALETSNGSENPEEFMKDLMNNPSNIMNLVKNIGTKLQDKMKSDDFNEGEMMQEASDIMKQMNDLPGLKEMMGKMNMPGKMNMGSMMNKMDQMSKEEKTKQRMRDKMEKRQMEKKIEQEVIQKLMNNKELEKNEDGMFVFKDDTSIKISKSKRKKRKNKPKI